MLNVTNVLKLADFVEKSLTYDQGTYFGESDTCETPGCICGHAVALFGIKVDWGLSHEQWQLGVGKMRQQVSERLGLTNKQQNKLFCGVPLSELPYVITAHHAAEVLRNLVKTGRVAW